MVKMKHNPINITIGALVVSILILLFANSYNCNNKRPSPRQPIETISIYEHLKEVDSIERFIAELYYQIDSINELKQKVITKTQTFYVRIGKDTTLSKEVLYNHTLLDDTLVSYPFKEMVQFRLIQGLETRGLLNLSKVEKNVLKTIIDSKNDIIGRDSVLIQKLNKENIHLVDTFNKVNMEAAMLEIKNRKLKSKNKNLLISTGILSAVLIFIGLR
jgi:hypothetical protein